MSFLRPSDDPAVAVRQLAQWLAADDPEPLLIETSGSTGRPKGVVLPRSAVLASVTASARRLGASGRWLLALPSSYVAGVQVVVRSLVAGHEPVVVEGLDLVAAVGASPDDAPVFTSLVPTQLHRVLDDPTQVAALARCHTVLVGGGGIDPALRHRAEEAGIHVVTTYGSSETAGGCVYDGLPLDGVGVTIAADGRVRLAGPTLFSHYLDDPGLTAETLVDGWFLTSDAGRLDEDGRLRVLGRIDDVVISGGVKVPLPAVARRLREHPSVEQAEVLGVPDDEWGQRLVAVVVGGAVPDAELRDWVGEVHPRSWAPREVRRVDALPLLANGKVDRQALRSSL
ncbi:AMP-binding protein [Nocardioides oleivorans]|uniref:AMP-binding protein n=1 Tax=Nocardioides oleivorans TaxID=273676 RepID=UPI001F5CEE06|nr:AMP-binding protein [Nocardioides oleivorans]